MFTGFVILETLKPNKLMNLVKIAQFMYFYELS